jgi:dihydroorotate dehydrogenase
MHVKGLSNAKPKPKPVLLKIAPDLTVGQLNDVIAILKETKLDGVIATNTTISREGLTTSESDLNKIGAGGLSGRPLTARSLEIVRHLRKELGKDVLIIGSGGIMTPQDAIDRMNAGADLIQLYTGFVYEGPSLVKKILKEIRS